MCLFNVETGFRVLAPGPIFPVFESYRSAFGVSVGILLHMVHIGELGSVYYLVGKFAICLFRPSFFVPSRWTIAPSTSGEQKDYTTVYI